VINAENAARTLNVRVDGESRRWTAVMGRCAPESAAVGSYPVEVAALDFAVCRSLHD